MQGGVTLISQNQADVFMEQEQQIEKLKAIVTQGIKASLPLVLDKLKNETEQLRRKGLNDYVWYRQEGSEEFPEFRQYSQTFTDAVIAYQEQLIRAQELGLNIDQEEHKRRLRETIEEITPRLSKRYPLREAMYKQEMGLIDAVLAIEDPRKIEYGKTPMRKEDETILTKLMDKLDQTRKQYLEETGEDGESDIIHTSSQISRMFIDVLGAYGSFESGSPGEPCSHFTQRVDSLITARLKARRAEDN